MDHGQLPMVADKFQWGFSEALLNACGKDVQFCRRTRSITPLRLGLARTATWARQRVETLADVCRGFKALFGTSSTDKAFDNPVATPHCADCSRRMRERRGSELTLTGLGGEKGRAFSEGRALVRQDGRACALHDGGRAVLPGRFKGGKPAAVARHTTLALRCDAPPSVVLPPDPTNEP